MVKHLHNIKLYIMFLKYFAFIILLRVFDYLNVL